MTPLRTLLEAMCLAGTISRADLDLLLITDDLLQAMRHIEIHAVQAFGLRRRAPAPSTILGEPGALTPRAADR